MIYTNIYVITCAPCVIDTQKGGLIFHAQLQGNFLVVPKDYCDKNTKFTMQCEEGSQDFFFVKVLNLKHYSY